MTKLRLPLTGFVQVYFVSVNTYFLAHEMYAGVLIAAFIISLVWSFNVKKVAFGTWPDRLMYAGGKKKKNGLDIGSVTPQNLNKKTTFEPVYKEKKKKKD